MSPDRTFLVITPALDGRDGISEVSRQAVRALVASAAADRVETWSLEGGAPPDADGVPSHAFRSACGRRRRIAGWSASRAARSLEGLTVVVMHLHLTPLAVPLAARGARVVVFLHGIEAWRPLRRRDRYAIAVADRIVANSTRTADRFRAANPDVRPSLVVCHLGVRTAPSAASAPADRGFALIVGRLSSAERYKGHDALIDAWSEVLAGAPEARLVIAGDGDDRERLASRVAERGLANVIRFAGRVSDAQLRGLYRACALFVMPSSGEGFGLAYLEAMREAKPCIALRSASEIIDDGVTGLLVDDSRPDALAGALVQLLTSPSMRNRMGQAAAAKVETYFAERHFVHRFQHAIGVATADSRSLTAADPASANA